MKNTTQSLLAAAVALTALTGLAALGEDGGAGAAAVPSGESARVPVQRTALICPRPTSAEEATTVYTAFTPPADGSRDEEAGRAGLLPAADYAPGDGGDADGGEDRSGEDGDEEAGGDNAVVPLEEPGSPVTAVTRETGAPSLTGTAEDRLAPGWTVQQTTNVRSGTARGLMGTACRRPDTGFWFAGASTVESRHDYVHLTNPDEAATVVDIELHGPDGPLDPAAGQGIPVPGRSAVRVLLSTLTDEPQTGLAVQVTARTGRIGAQIEVVDERLGTDWLPPADTAGRRASGPVVLPGIPSDARTARLVAFTPGEEDLSFDVGLAGPSGTITPAGNESLSIPSGTLAEVDLQTITQGAASSLVLTPAANSGTGPLVAALRITRGEGDGQETAFIPASAPVQQRATASGTPADGAQLYLTAPGKAVEAEVTYSAGTDGGEAVTETYSIDGGTTLALAPEVPEDTEGRFAVTVERTGGGPLYAARALTSERGGVQALTVQTLPDDDSTVVAPGTRQDISILTR